MSRRQRLDEPDRPAPSQWVAGGWIWSPEAGDWISGSSAPLSLPPAPETTPTPEEAPDGTV